MTKKRVLGIQVFYLVFPFTTLLAYASIVGRAV